LLSSSLVLVAPAVHAAAWESRAPMLEARQEVAVAELDGRMYVIGGFFAAEILFGIAATVEVYDPETEEWSFVAPLPVGLHHTAAASVGGLLYVIGGWQDFFGIPVADVYAYDPAADEWTPREPMPTARAGHAATVLDGRIYVAGGSPDERAHDFAVYDPIADEWTVLPDMPTPRNHLGVAALAGRILAVAGRSGGIFPVAGTGALEAYDPGTQEWEPLAPMPTPRSGIAAAVFQDRLIVFGGEGGSPDPSGVFRETEAYDPEANAWRALPQMPTGRHGIGAAVLDDGVHVAGGGPVEGFGVTDVHEVFVPEPSVGIGTLAALLGLAAVGRRRARTASAAG
jgi:N-acetylneuraminic acid mutarotase